jgi:hypothetical protein
MPEHFRQYRRIKSNGTVGELTKNVEVKAPNIAEAIVMAQKGYLEKVAFELDFTL